MISIQYYVVIANRDYWMTLIDMCLMIATRYNVVVACWCLDQRITFLTIIARKGKHTHDQVIILGFLQHGALHCGKCRLLTFLLSLFYFLPYILLFVRLKWKKVFLRRWFTHIGAIMILLLKVDRYHIIYTNIFTGISRQETVPRDALLKSILLHIIYVQ